jgi:hypothetical protein
MSVIRLHPVTINTGQLDGITEVARTDGNQVIRPTPDGILDPKSSFRSAANPRIMVATLSIGAALTLLGTKGILAAPFVAWGALEGEDGDKSATGAYKATMANCRLLPRSLTVSTDDNAMLTFEAIGYGSDISYAFDQNLSAIISGNDSDDAFALGPVKVNGELVETVQAVTINFGLTEFVERGDGLILPKSVGLTAPRLPTISVGVMDGSHARKVMRGSGPFSGVKPLDGTNGVQVWFKKRAEDGDFVAAGTASHVKISATHGMGSNQGAAGQPQLTTLFFEPRKGTNSLLVDAASTYPTS